ncbi:MAG: hypothetical protein ACLQD8_04060 [Thermoplasmata archaeon]
MAAPPPEPAPWGSCRFCGVAVRPEALTCGICGADGPIAAGGLASAPRTVRRRVRWTATLRTLIVIGVAVGLAYTLIDAVLTGPPSVADPLTTSGVHSIPVGSVFVLSGDITGGDYVIGNYTTIDPAGLSLAVAVYNSTEWSALGLGRGAVSAWSSPPQPAGRIIFSAPYTDSYYFEFTNPYPTTSGLNVTAYITTEYESNVGDEGFG